MPMNICYSPLIGLLLHDLLWAPYHHSDNKSVLQFVVFPTVVTVIFFEGFTDALQPEPVKPFVLFDGDQPPSVSFGRGITAVAYDDYAIAV